MSKSSKNDKQKNLNHLPLFDTTESSIQKDSPSTTPSKPSSNVICFSTAIELRNVAKQASSEKDALESILARASKLNW